MVVANFTELLLGLLWLYLLGLCAQVVFQGNAQFYWTFTCVCGFNLKIPVVLKCTFINTGDTDVFQAKLVEQHLVVPKANYQFVVKDDHHDQNDHFNMSFHFSLFSNIVSVLQCPLNGGKVWITTTCEIAETFF